MEKNKPIRIELTEEQKKLVREATGKDAAAIEFSAEELEERVSPGRILPEAEFGGEGAM